jgi:hypothetical protein
MPRVACFRITCCCRREWFSVTFALLHVPQSQHFVRGDLALHAPGMFDDESAGVDRAAGLRKALNQPKSFRTNYFRDHLGQTCLGLR